MATAYIQGEERTLDINDVAVERNRVDAEGAPLADRTFTVTAYQAVVRVEKDAGGNVEAFVLGWEYTVTVA